jgi:hypothetical protein
MQKSSPVSTHPLVDSPGHWINEDSSDIEMMNEDIESALWKGPVKAPAMSCPQSCVSSELPLDEDPFSVLWTGKVVSATPPRKTSSRSIAIHQNGFENGDMPPNCPSSSLQVRKSSCSDDLTSSSSTSSFSANVMDINTIDEKSRSVGPSSSMTSAETTSTIVKVAHLLETALDTLVEKPSVLIPNWF